MNFEVKTTGLPDGPEALARTASSVERRSFLGVIIRLPGAATLVFSAALSTVEIFPWQAFADPDGIAARSIVHAALSAALCGSPGRATSAQTSDCYRNVDADSRRGRQSDCAFKV